MKIVLFVIVFPILAFSIASDPNGSESLLKNNYDQVLHFSYSIESEEVDFDNLGNSKWLTTALPDKLNRKLAEELFDLGYKRKEISKKRFVELNQVFSCKPVDVIVSSECLPIYRDILIFRDKRSKEVKYIVQVCFECSQANFVGVSENTGCFGQNGEFAELKKIIRKEN